MLYELVMRGTYFGQEVVNRWNYVSTGVPASVLGSFALVSAFGAIPDLGVYPPDAPFSQIYAALSDQLVLSSLEARAAKDYDVEDFYERPFIPAYDGGVSGAAMSPTAAYGFRTNRVRLDIARGTKRFAGVIEEAVGSGGVLVGSWPANLEAMAEAMSDVLEYDDEGNTVTFTPCVVSKEEYTTPSGRKAYRYYSTLATQMEHVATGITWQPYSTVRTQVSRQYGRGS